MIVVKIGPFMFCAGCQRERLLLIVEAEWPSYGVEVLTLECPKCKTRFAWERTMN